MEAIPSEYSWMFSNVFIQVGAECGKNLQAANIGLCPGIETFYYSSGESYASFEMSLFEQRMPYTSYWDIEGGGGWVAGHRGLK